MPHIRGRTVWTVYIKKGLPEGMNPNGTKIVKLVGNLVLQKTSYFVFQAMY